LCCGCSTGRCSSGRQAVAAKDKFFSDISHDMRTPLNAVIGFSTLALRPQATAQEKDSCLAKIQTSGKLLLDLINDTLSISKMDNGKLELHKAPVSIEEIGTSIMGPISAIAAQKGVILIWTNPAAGPEQCWPTSSACRKSFLNLLNNAVKFTPAGRRIWITVKDEPAGAKDAALVVEIKDEGIGIGREFLPRIFEPFAQEGREGYKGTGTGLGLSIVKRLTGPHGRHHCGRKRSRPRHVLHRQTAA
jgi:signal transduction histidine kinase